MLEKVRRGVAGFFRRATDSPAPTSVQPTGSGAAQVDPRIEDARARLAEIAADLGPDLRPPADMLDGTSLERFVLEVQTRTYERRESDLWNTLAERIRLLRAAIAGADTAGTALHAGALADLVERELAGAGRKEAEGGPGRSGSRRTKVEG